MKLIYIDVLTENFSVVDQHSTLIQHLPTNQRMIEMNHRAKPFVR